MWRTRREPGALSPAMEAALFALVEQGPMVSCPEGFRTGPSLFNAGVLRALALRGLASAVPPFGTHSRSHRRVVVTEAGLDRAEALLRRTAA